VTDDALTIEELRRRRAEILDLAGARSSSNCRFRFRCQGEAAQAVISIFSSAASPVPLFLITLPWSNTLRNF